ncbi:probable mitochondrial adenine nucleotide transporter BTL3 [Prosopis cineraria]|uniref:probable mitochondrial adenine nucleotide transporter BTL3 n=1 Tax=Prosopis cineraria TaxID=364024 RepID=UPI0024106B22|nr:probable mitochondrial adenine nucleotide transporter BTL3 [Prosopis cineraria]XP_054788530.1 probable mitochondrial adenine nucleotide transporter BTL3 [Prosopis cineraria]
MPPLELCCSQEQSCPPILFKFNCGAASFNGGGLFLEPTVPVSFSRLISSRIPLGTASCSASSAYYSQQPVVFGGFRRPRRTSATAGGWFLSASLRGGKFVGDPKIDTVQNGGKSSDKAVSSANAVAGQRKSQKVRVRGGSAMNTTKHLWAGAIAAMVSRTCVAPLERLKLEYIVRGEQKNIFELIKTIAASQGLRGFWKGNLVNILRTAPFKAVNFCAYDTYRKQLLTLSGNEETTNFERFIAGAAAGITATIICLPLDTIRTKIVAPGGEALGGVIGAFRYMIHTEGFFSLYKGLVPSIISMAPSGAVYYGVYDILKSAYLHSPKGMKRIQNMKKEGQELNAFDQLELGPIRTLLYGAISGACAEAATYPFEVVRRQLQMQVQSTKLSSLATCIKIVERGGIAALYAGLIPSLLQVLPSAAISYFVYEFMKIVLKVE